MTMSESRRAASLYESEPSVPPARIPHLTGRKVSAIGLPPASGEPSYADFIGGPAHEASPRLEEREDAS